MGGWVVQDGVVGEYKGSQALPSSGVVTDTVVLKGPRPTGVRAAMTQTKVEKGLSEETLSVLVGVLVVQS